MTEEQQVAQEVTNELVQEAPAVEQAAQEQPQERTVPLSALEAERKKRQEAELRAFYAEQQRMQQPQPQQKDEDEDDYTRQLKASLLSKIKEETRKEREQEFLRRNPDAVSRIEAELPEILKKRPSLAFAIQNAENKYEEAMAIIEDYSTKRNDTQRRIEANSMKPGTPTGAAKSAKLSKSEMIANMSSQDFHQWRKGLRRR